MNWAIARESDDSIADVRISLGRKRPLGSYMVFRGKPEDVIELLEAALSEAKRSLPIGLYSDKRFRGQG